VARGSAKREKLVELAGKMQVPYLVDPNTGTQMFESADINAYLDRTYGPGSNGASAAAVVEPPAQEAAEETTQGSKAGTQTVTVEAELLDKASFAEDNNR